MRDLSGRNHVQKVHEQSFEYKCEFCEYKSNRKASAKRHMETVHKLNPRNRLVFKCGFCDYKTSKEDLLQNHISQIHILKHENESQSIEDNSLNIEEVIIDDDPLEIQNENENPKVEESEIKMDPLDVKTEIE